MVDNHVRCFCVRRLHAKVYVADDTVFVGSNNASHNSADVLTELAVRIDDAAFARQAMAWIGSLQAVLLDREDVEPLVDLYEPQTHRERAPRSRPKKRARNSNTLWLTYYSRDFDEPDSPTYEAWAADSEAQLRGPRRFVHCPIFATGERPSRIQTEGRPGDEVILVDVRGKKVYGPMRVLNRAYREKLSGRTVRASSLEEDVEQVPSSFKRFRQYLMSRGVARLAESGMVEREVRNSRRAQVMRSYLLGSRD